VGNAKSGKGQPVDATTGASQLPTKIAVGLSPALPLPFDYDGSEDPFPIAWLDANDSHNQMPGDKKEPSHIYHFKGLVARCNGFAGQGTDGRATRCPSAPRRPILAS